MNKTLLTLTALIMIALLPTADAATVFLKDGSLVKGTIVGATARDVQLHTADGTLRISTERISRIEYSDAASTPETPAPSVPSDERPSDMVESFPLAYRTYERRPLNHHFSFDFGLAVPASEVSFSEAGGGSDDNGDSGGLFGFQYLYSFRPRWGLGLNMEFMNRSGADSSQLLPAADAEVSGNSFVIMPVIRYTLVKTGSVRPYLMAGIGANRTSTVIDAQPTIGFAWSDTSTDEPRRLINDRTWGLASTARFGIDFNAAGPNIFSLELGWTRFDNPKAEASFAGRDLGVNGVTGDLDVLTIGGRIGWKF